MVTFSPEQASVPLASAVLEQAAALAPALAAQLCASAIGGADCAALHGIWPRLRLLQLAADPDRHGAFYPLALGACAAAAPRVLISGCADFGMLATTIAAYRAHAAPLAATVIDLCPTPLLLCAGYGAIAGQPVRTAQADARLFTDEQPFDVICVHSLLTYYPLAGRRQLVRNWARLLRRGGEVVTVTRLQSPAESSVESAAERSERALNFGELAIARSHLSGRAGAELRARAQRFAAGPRGHPVGNEVEVRGLFEDAGFVLTRFDVRQLGDARGAHDRINGTARGGVYAEIVAVRQ